MDWRDSRRLTGPSLLLDGPGAILDVPLGAASPGVTPQRAAVAWREALTPLLAAVGWAHSAPAERFWRGGEPGVSLAFPAPIDALYAATEVNEQAWATAAAALTGAPAPDFAAAVERLRGLIHGERCPALLALRDAASHHGVAFVWDDDKVSLGSGRGSRTYPRAELPDPDAVDWPAVYDVPVVLVTGTNGKTTTVRLLAAIAQEAGVAPGFSSTDGVWVDGSKVASGDYSGPEGARAVLRESGAGFAILETARGGLLRRGLPVDRATVAVVTNVAEDHLGEWGIFDLDGLADTKMLVAKAAEQLVLFADDPLLTHRAAATGRPITWFTLGSPPAQGPALALQGEDLVVVTAEGRREVLARLADVPITLGGAARHNVANVLAAVGAALAAGLPLAAVRKALAGFRSTPDANPGRLNEFEVGGVRVFVDFAHNPHGVAALAHAVAALPAARRLVLLGQAGDRDDASIRGLARSVWQARPDRVVIKEMEKYLRGRPLGEIPALLADELRCVGAPEEIVSHAASEIAGARAAFEWAQTGDLLLLLCHESRSDVLHLIERLQRAGWTPGHPLP